MTNYGLSEETIRAICDVLQRHQSVEKALLYGSRAKGTFRTGSDIDLTLIGKDIQLNEQFRIENELDDLLLPYKIDLSIFHEISNKDLIDHINRVGKVIYPYHST